MSWVLLTGASRGIGRATALRLAARGLHVGAVGRASAAQAALAAELSGMHGAGSPGAAGGAGCTLAEADLTDAAATERAVAALLDRLGAPRAVINNAGVIHRARVVDTSTAALDEQLAVNLRAPFVISRAVLPALLAARQGTLVQVGSISSTLGSPGAAAYAASKWALVGFMRSLAAELTDTGVTTVAVLPGSTDTDMLQGSGFPPRMTADAVAATLVHHALDAPAAHNGAVIEMFGV